MSWRFATSKNSWNIKLSTRNQRYNIIKNPGAPGRTTVLRPDDDWGRPRLLLGKYYDIGGLINK